MRGGGHACEVVEVGVGRRVLQCVDGVFETEHARKGCALAPSGEGSVRLLGGHAGERERAGGVGVAAVELHGEGGHECGVCCAHAE